MKIQIDPENIPKVYYDDEEKKFYVIVNIQEMDKYRDETVLCVGELEKTDE